MGNLELLEAEHARTAPRRVERRRASHATDADDDDVVFVQAVRQAAAACSVDARWPSVIALNAIVKRQQATIVANTPVQPQ